MWIILQYRTSDDLYTRITVKLQTNGNSIQHYKVLYDVLKVTATIKLSHISHTVFTYLTISVSCMIIIILLYSICNAQKC